MRLFVAVWPPEVVVERLAAVLADRNPTAFRLIRAGDWHVTLAFLGEVPTEHTDQVAAAVESLAASTPPATATLGPATGLLGRGVLCVPVDGLDELADQVRSATGAFNRSGDRDRPFVGHLTLARARRRAPVPRGLLGVALAASWEVGHIRLVASSARPEGAAYSPVAVARLAG